MSDKNRKDAALDTTNTAGVIEYTDEQVAEDERRERRAEQINKKLARPEEEIVGLPEQPEPEHKAKKKHA